MKKIKRVGLKKSAGRTTAIPSGKTNGAAPINASTSPINSTELPLNCQPKNPPNPQTATEVNTTPAVVDSIPTLLWLTPQILDLITALGC